MRASLARWQSSPFERASKTLLRTARRTERRRVEKHQKRREEGTNELNKAQYINAFIEARSAAFSHNARLTKGLVSLDSVQPGTLAPSSPDQLRLLATELEERYGSKSLRPRSGSGGVSSSLPVSREPVAFGDWRVASGDVHRQSAAADFIVHCVLREAKTPPGWSFEAFARILPLKGKPLSSLIRFVEEVVGQSAPMGEAQSTRQPLSLSALRKRERDVAHRVLHLNPIQRLALTSFIIQRLVARSGSWHIAHEYLLNHVVGGGTDGVPLKEYKENVSQQIAVFAEAVRYLDLPREETPPLSALRELLQSAQDEFARVSGSTLPKHNLSPVVAAPLLSIACTHEGEDLQTLRELCDTFLFHRKPFPPSRPPPPTNHRPVYMPAVAWGEYLRALRRCGATVADIQQATDDITDPEKTQNAESLLGNVHVWNGYLSCVDATHALEVFETNRKHYGLRETPATIAVLMRALAEDGPGRSPDGIKRGLALYQKLKETAGRHVIGTAGVLSALLALREASSDLRGVLSFAVDFDNTLVYFNVPGAWWSSETEGEDLSRTLASIPEEDVGALLSVSHPCQLYFERVCREYQVPPTVSHAFSRAFASTTRAAQDGGGSTKDTPELSPEDLAAMM